MESPEQEIFTQSFFMIINVTKWLYFFQELEKDPRQPVYSKTATHFLENYKFPVMMILALSNGTIVHRVNANDFMHKEDSGPTMSYIYNHKKTLCKDFLFGRFHYSSMVG
jgi:hypothetical protein